MTAIDQLLDQYTMDRYRTDLRTMSIPSALWAQVQEIEKHREALRAAFLALADSADNRAKMQALITEQERLIIHWHRLFLDSMSGVEALKTSSFGEVLK